MRTLSPEEFAIRVREKELEGVLTKEVRVPEGTMALLFVEDKYDGTLSPGVHKLEGGGIGALFGRGQRRSVVMVRSLDTQLDFLVPRLLTKDPLFVELACRLVVKLRPGGETAFAINVMASRDHLDLNGLRSLLFGEVKEAAQSWAGRHSVEELAENLALKQQLAYEMEAHLEQTFQRYGLSFSGIQTSNFRCQFWDEAREKKVDVYVQVSKEEAELAGRQRLSDVYNRSQLQELAQETEKVALYEMRAQVWDRMRRAATTEKMSQITSERELEEFIRDTDRDKLLKEADYEDFKRNLAHTLDDHERARAHINRLAEMEREYDLKRADLSGEHGLSQQEVEAEIGLERLRVEWQREIEMKRADLELDKERHRAELELDMEDRAATQELRQQVERRRADIEAEEDRQRLALQRQQEELDLKLKELGEQHRLEIDKMQAMDGLSIHGLIAIAGDSKAPLLAELARTEAMKDLSVEKILAMAAEKSPVVAQSLAELASKAGSEEQKQFYERFLSEQKEAQTRIRETYQEFSKIQQEMFNKALETQSQIAQAYARGQAPPAPPAPGAPATPAGAPQRVVVCRHCLVESPVGTKHCPNCGESLMGRVGD